MKILRLGLYAIVLLSLIQLKAYGGSPFIKATTVGTTGRDASVMFAIGSNFYVGGGGENKDFWVYNSDSNTMRKLGNIPGVNTNRAFGTAFSIGGKGYVCLGFDGSALNATLKNDLWQFDPSTSKWTQMADLPGNARDGAFVFVVGNVAYVGGGSDNVYLFNDFYAYNSVTNKWSQKNITPLGYNIFTNGFAINNTGYIALGQSGSVETKVLYKYDTTDDSWAQMTDFPGAARQTAVAMVMGSKAYVGLGQQQDDSTTTYSDFYAYDPSANSWAKITSFPGGNRAWACAASNGTKGCIGFGWDLNKKFYNDIWSFDPSQATGFKLVQPLKSSIDIYPNPASDVLKITSDNRLNVKSITLTDVTGKIIRTIQPDSQISGMNFDISGLEKGIYFLNFISNQGSEVKRFVVN